MDLMEKKKLKIGIITTVIGLTISGLFIYSTGGVSIMPNNDDNLANIKENESINEDVIKDDDVNEEEEAVIATVMKNENDLAVLCNKVVGLGDEYQPIDLVVPNVSLVHPKTYQQSQLREDSAKALEEMFRAAKEAGLEELFLVSGYRSYDYQNELFSNSLANRGKEHTEKYMAKPGHSEHQTGLTADISTRSVGFSLEESFENTNEGKWLAENAHKYGFILRYPKDRVETTGYAYEPWHFRYVGKDISSYMFKNNLVLEDLYDVVETNANAVG